MPHDLLRQQTVQTRSLQRCVQALLALCLFSGATGAVQAKTLNVTNHGGDSPTCGGTTTPCRSISQAITNAADGDRISVGPGRYGMNFGEVAEVNTGCNCLLKVNKQLTVESRAGAAATVLEAGGVAVDVVQISASSVSFGKKNSGFTLTGAGETEDYRGSGIRINPDDLVEIRVEGNIASENSAHGFDVSGVNLTVTQNVARNNGRYGFVGGGPGMRIANNEALNNGEYGFDLTGSGDVADNVATGNGADGGFDLTGAGGELKVTHNVASR